MRWMCLAILALTATAHAHHSFSAEYDAKAIVTLTGKIRKVDWSNPHIHIQLDVAGRGGKVATWTVDGYPPNTLARSGFSRELLKLGDTITITGYRAKNGSNTAAGREVTFPDGSKKALGAPAR